MKIRIEYETSRKEIVVMGKKEDPIGEMDALTYAIGFWLLFLKLNSNLRPDECNMIISATMFSKYCCDDWDGYILKLINNQHEPSKDTPGIGNRNR